MKANHPFKDPFTKRALQIYEDAKTQIGYVAHRFRQKILRDGGRAAAKHWLRPSNVTPGFQRLLKHDRIDLSVEAVAIQSPWNKLFTEAELATARNRLAQFGYKVPPSKKTTVSYWVVSPNVRNNEDTVGDWRRASVIAHAAFMGWYPNDSDSQIGPKFAGKTKGGIKPNDIILIARQHHHKPEIVGFGVVVGKAARTINGFKAPQTFGSLRKLRPFCVWSRPPSNIPLSEAVRHIQALAQLHPDTNDSHRAVCEWINQQLQQKSFGRSETGRENRQKSSLHNSQIVASPKNHQLDYKIQTKAKSIKAKKVEAWLLENYRHWLWQQGRKLSAVRYMSLQCDAYEEDRRNLIEAKSSASREHIRMAVGQLLDYAFQGNKKFGDPHKAILLPNKLQSDIVAWLDSLNIKIIWREKGVFSDNANGQFT